MLTRPYEMCGYVFTKKQHCIDHALSHHFWEVIFKCVTFYGSFTWRIYLQLWNLLFWFHHQTMPIWAYGTLTYSGQVFQLWIVWFRFLLESVPERQRFELLHLKNVNVKNAMKLSPGSHGCWFIQLLSTLDMNISFVNCAANVSWLYRDWTLAR